MDAIFEKAVLDYPILKENGIEDFVRLLDGQKAELITRAEEKLTALIAEADGPIIGFNDTAENRISHYLNECDGWFAPCEWCGANERWEHMADDDNMNEWGDMQADCMNAIWRPAAIAILGSDVSMDF